MKTKYSIFNSILLCVLFVAEAQASTLDDIGFTDLSLELGMALPDGGGIIVTQVEVSIGGACAPDITNSEFNSITFVDSTASLCTGVSNHATNVAKFFYGSSLSSSPGVGTSYLFETVNWLFGGFLRSGEGVAPDVHAARIANHSWIGNAGAGNADVLRRVDYIVGVDEFIQVVGLSTSPTNNHLLSDSFNAIAVGLSKGTVGGTKAIDSIYTGGRARPDIVAPQGDVSSASPRVASAAALLIGHANDNPSLSTDLLVASTTNRNGDVIYNAERSETIKAILMAGADRNTLGNTNPVVEPVDITDYRVIAGDQTSNGLDRRFGAGQLNIYNSYHILDAGEQNSEEDWPANLGAIANQGFDYDPAFGGKGGSNATASYNFSTNGNSGQKLKADLVWNLNATSSPSVLYDMDLQLIDVTGGGSIVASSNSAIDNTENIWFNLLSNRDYQLQVIRGSGQAVFDWDYAIAWQIMVPDINVVEGIGLTTTAEDGTTDTFTVVLGSPPVDDITISVVSSDINEGTVFPSSLTFTPANWSTLQTVTVTGVNDLVDDGDKNYDINFTVSSLADTNYHGMTVDSVAVSNTDDDATLSFTDQADVALNTVITSDTVVITGLLSATAISITGGEYSINGGVYVLTSGTINNSDSVTVQTSSSVTGLMSVDVKLTIGDISDTFTVTTEVDTDGDGVGNTLDTNDDNDGFDDAVDNCMLTSNDQLDTDGDNYGNACDADFNNDNFVNSLDVGLFKAAMFSAGAQDADMNGDAIVNSLDVGLFKIRLFTQPGPSGLNP